MNDLRTAAQQALEALENCASEYGHRCNRCDSEIDEGGKVAAALRAALAQPEPTTEPVAWMYTGIRFNDTPHDRPTLIWRPEYMDVMSAFKGVKATPLYTAPPQRKPLSEDEQVSLAREMVKGNKSVEWFVRAVEKAHGITPDADPRA